MKFLADADSPRQAGGKKIALCTIMGGGGGEESPVIAWTAPVPT